MAASSTSTTGVPLSPGSSSGLNMLAVPLDLPKIGIRIANALGRGTKNTPGSSSRAGSSGRSDRSGESFAPCEYSPIYKEEAKLIAEMAQSIFLSDSATARCTQMEMAQAEALLRRFLHKTDGRVRIQEAILIQGSTNKPTWKKFPRHSVIQDCYNDRAQKAIVQLIEAMRVFIRMDRYSLEVRKLVNGRVRRKCVPLTSIIDRLLANNHMRNVINDGKLGVIREEVLDTIHQKGHKEISNIVSDRYEPLMPKVTNTYLALMHKRTYDDVYAISQALNEIEHYSFWEGLSKLRQFVTDRHTQNNSFLVIENPINFYGYRRQARDLSSEQRAEVAQNLRLNPALILSHNGEEICPVFPNLINCRSQANSAKQTIKLVKDREQRSLDPEETLKIRFEKQLELDYVAQTCLRFEHGFRGFVESTLNFFERHFNEHLIEFDIDLQPYYEQLSDGLEKPYDWGKLGSLLGKLDHLVYKLLVRNAIPDPSLQKSGFSRTPRKRRH